MAPPRSVIWNYFQTFMQDDLKIGKCKECDKNVKCGVSGTQGLKLHLRNHHEGTYEEFCKLRDGNKNLNDTETVEPREIENTEKIKSKSPEPNIDKVILSGDEFPNDTVSAFKDMLKDEHFTNVTLVTDGNKRIKAHKVILSSFSPFFKEILINNPHQHPLIYLRGVKYEYLQAMVHFMYLGQTKINLENVNDFIKVASDLQVKGLCSSEPSTDAEEELQKEEVVGDKHVRKEVEADISVLDTTIGEEFESMETVINDFEQDDNLAIKEESTDCATVMEAIPVTAVMDSEKDVEDTDIALLDAEKANIPCEFADCKYVAAKKRYLREHRQAIHEGIKYPCDLCDHKGSTKSNLKKHVQIRHTEEKYPCHQCNHLASSIVTLSEHHENIHSNN